MLRGILRRENPIGGAPLERAVVLKWFYSLSRRKTFVGGKCYGSILIRCRLAGGQSFQHLRSKLLLLHV